jgi:hypothetical protein
VIGADIRARAPTWPVRHPDPTGPEDAMFGLRDGTVSDDGECFAPQRDDPDDLSAENDAVDINRRSRADAVAVDDVHASRLGRKREPAARTGLSTDAIGTGTLLSATASSSSWHNRHWDDTDLATFVGLAEQPGNRQAVPGLLHQLVDIRSSAPLHPHHGASSGLHDDLVKALDDPMWSCSEG